MKKFILFFFLISSCALMNENDCRLADWSSLGQEDASAGYHLERFTKRQQICNQHGISANYKKYQTGYAKGLKFYCSYDNGITIGQKGKDDPNICPNKLKQDFQRGYLLGQRNREIQQLKEKQARSYRTSRKCFSEFDCDIKSKCRNDRCTHTHKSCFTDLDCDDFDSECQDDYCILIDND